MKPLFDNTFLLLLMLFLHIFADFHMQGNLALWKQQSWWQQNRPQGMYQNDYLVALILHSFEWVFFIMLPVAIRYGTDGMFLVVFVSNLIVHAFVDNAKANWHMLNLIQDQVIHLMQIILTYTIFILS